VQVQGCDWGVSCVWVVEVWGGLGVNEGNRVSNHGSASPRGARKAVQHRAAASAALAHPLRGEGGHAGRLLSGDVPGGQQRVGGVGGGVEGVRLVNHHVGLRAAAAA
jgi:hypothetical protein